MSRRTRLIMESALSTKNGNNNKKFLPENNNVNLLPPGRQNTESEITKEPPITYDKANNIDRFIENEGVKSQFDEAIKNGLRTPSPLTHPCGFPAEKRNALLKNLDQVIPNNRREFWLNMPTR
ncbi:unnamed protein product [Brassicogethes aeneus]|uniref:Uncharacterized protein n=1 Tax=Brassicogethes aeneus TaxID=1431903 RepID=A0A9P0ATS0_BRAAE|nr:unnamed protein product [Brassicogethes aeneus]